MDYIEKLLVSRRKKKRIHALNKRGLNPREISERIGCSRQYVVQVLKDRSILENANAKSSGKTAC